MSRVDMSLSDLEEVMTEMFCHDLNVSGYAY